MMYNEDEEYPYDYQIYDINNDKMIGGSDDYEEAKSLTTNCAQEDGITVYIFQVVTITTPGSIPIKIQEYEY